MDNNKGYKSVFGNFNGRRLFRPSPTPISDLSASSTGVSSSLLSNSTSTSSNSSSTLAQSSSSSSQQVNRTNIRVFFSVNVTVVKKKTRCKVNLFEGEDQSKIFFETKQTRIERNIKFTIISTNERIALLSGYLC